MTVWYTARGAGLAALVLLTASTVLGAALSGPASRGGVRAAQRRYLGQHAHRVCAVFGLGALALHLGAILADGDAGVGWRAALVPFASGYRPLWVGLGTLAAWTVLAVAGLGAARGRIAATAAGARSWRALHALGYAGWAAAMWHGFATGTDSSLGWVRALYLICAAAVVGAVIGRLSLARVPDRRAVDRARRRTPLPVPVSSALEIR